jgi:hypothetical protein
MYEYPEAGKNAQPEVKEAVERFRQLSDEEKSANPLLYWLLGAGTPPYKVSKKDCDYKEQTEIPNQTCANCEFFYLKPSKQIYICSQIEGKVGKQAWCNRWKFASGLKQDNEHTK